jgi:hypothetical protein
MNIIPKRVLCLCDSEKVSEKTGKSGKFGEKSRTISFPENEFTRIVVFRFNFQ